MLLPILPFLATLASPIPNKPVDTSTVTRPQPVLHTPDAIHDAVLPYLACLYAIRGLPLLKGADGKQVSYDKSDKDCSATRSRARADALKALEHSPVPGGDPAAYVENALTEMSDYVAAVPVRQGGGKAGGPPPIGIPFMMEDEVAPAYEKYVECLKTQVAYTTVTPDTVLTVFQQVMKICQSVRDSAMLQAENALAQKGWDEARRTRAVESTFSTADQSWLEMGRQFRDSLGSRSNR